MSTGDTHTTIDSKFIHDFTPGRQVGVGNLSGNIEKILQELCFRLLYASWCSHTALFSGLFCHYVLPFLFSAYSPFKKRENKEQHKHNQKVFIKMRDASGQLDSDNLTQDNVIAAKRKSRHIPVYHPPSSIRGICQFMSFCLFFIKSIPSEIFVLLR
jgi:hypothetical protein